MKQCQKEDNSIVSSIFYLDSTAIISWFYNANNESNDNILHVV